MSYRTIDLIVNSLWKQCRLLSWIVKEFRLIHINEQNREYQILGVGWNKIVQIDGIGQIQRQTPQLILEPLRRTEAPLNGSLQIPRIPNLS